MSEHPETEPIQVDFVADLACPWCYLGLVRLDRARAMRPERQVRMRWRPFFLNPDLPPEGMDRATYLRRKFGADATQVYRRIEDSARADGVAFAFQRMPRTPNTLLAHRLILYAEEQGRDDPVIRGLFRALFEEGRDVGDPAVLIEVAAAAGLERAEVAAFLASERFAREVREAHDVAERIGVRGVPVFIVAHAHAVTGAQPPEVLAGLLDVAATPQGSAAAP
jgi:predicted DsbA family dithiol-disulfide isomerase